jgi:hypothetical protein
LEGSSNIHAKSLRWGQVLEEDEGGQPPDFDVVLGADIVSLNVLFDLRSKSVADCSRGINDLKNRRTTRRSYQLWLPRSENSSRSTEA